MAVTTVKAPATVVANGHDANGLNLKNGLMTAEAHEVASSSLTTEQDLALRTFRMLIADLCQQFKGGHPG
jgi:dihydroxyacetone synthase